MNISSFMSFLLYVVLQIPVFLVGMCITSERERQEWSRKTAWKTYVSGQMIIWSVLHVMAVIMIQCRTRFNLLFWCFLIVTALLAIFGCRQYLQIDKPKRIWGQEWLQQWRCSCSPLVIVLLIMLTCLITMQFLNYFLGFHLDQDDARWLAEANDALVYGDMMTRDFSTGEYLGYFVTAKDVASPWPMLFAIIAGLLHVRTAVAAHTMYAPVALLLSYVSYMLIAGELFRKSEARLTFLLSVAVINMFYAGTTYTQSVFTLVRIWQGKATVAGVIIPFLVCLAISINKNNETEDWLRLAFTGCAACLMSGMGISMAGIMIGVCGIYCILFYRRWKRIPLWFLALAPTICTSLLYFYLKGVI